MWLNIRTPPPPSKKNVLKCPWRRWFKVAILTRAKACTEKTHVWCVTFPTRNELFPTCRFWTWFRKDGEAREVVLTVNHNIVGWGNNQMETYESKTKYSKSNKKKCQPMFRLQWSWPDLNSGCIFVESVVRFWDSMGYCSLIHYQNNISSKTW